MNHRRTIIAIAFAATGCASTAPATGGDVASWAPPVVETTDSSSQTEANAFDGSLEGYVDFALRHHPDLREAHANWAASRYRSAAAYDWPDPTLTYGFFIQPVETRVGPQQHRIGVMQPIPWPTKLEAASEAAGAGVKVEEHRFAAQMLEVRRRVAEIYWRVWAIDLFVEIVDEEVTITDGLAQSLRGRAEIGQASVADLAQVDLMLSRLRDRREALLETRRALAARLAEALGAGDAEDYSATSNPPTIITPTEAELAADIERAKNHPSLEVVDALKNQTRLQAEKADAMKLPDFALGVDYIVTGEAAMDVEDSGKDPIVAMLSVKLPIFSSAESASIDEANARGRALEARRDAAERRIVARIHDAASRMRDSERRANLYEHTLVPQAEAAYASVRSAYEVGKTGVAALLLAQRELIELREGLVSARADFARARADMDSLVSTEVSR